MPRIIVAKTTTQAATSPGFPMPQTRPVRRPRAEIGQRRWSRRRQAVQRAIWIEDNPPRCFGPVPLLPSKA